MIALTKEEKERVFEMMVGMMAIKYSKENEHTLDDYKGTDRDWLHDAFIAGFESCLNFQSSNQNAEDVLTKMIQEEMNKTNKK